MTRYNRMIFLSHQLKDWTPMNHHRFLLSKNSNFLITNKNMRIYWHQEKLRILRKYKQLKRWFCKLTNKFTIWMSLLTQAMPQLQLLIQRHCSKHLPMTNNKCLLQVPLSDPTNHQVKVQAAEVINLKKEDEDWPKKIDCKKHSWKCTSFILDNTLVEI